MITPLIDTLLHQVLGRRADMERISGSKPDSPLTEVLRIPESRDAAAKTGHPGGDTSLLTSPRNKGVGSPATEKAAGTAANSDDSAPPSVARDSRQVSGSAQLHLSREARTIASVINQFSNMPTAAKAEAPLISGESSPLVPVVAGALHRQLINSGVFYESHLAQWFSGQRSVEQLMNEPQARLNVSTAMLQQSQATSPLPLEGEEAVFNATDAGSIDDMASTGAQKPLSHSVHEALLPVLRQQLEVLGTSVFRWDGLAWPGAPLQWEIHDEGRQDEGDQAEHEAVGYPWSSYLTLSLPSLGELEIKLTLRGKALEVAFQSSTSDNSAIMSAESLALRERFEHAGFESLLLKFSTVDSSGHE